LFTTEVGLMSAAGILCLLGIGVCFQPDMSKPMHEDKASAAQHKP
jgi:hypothetical protein